MKIIRRIVIDIESGDILERDDFEYSGPLALCDRAAQGLAQQAATTAGGVGAGYGSQAAGISGALTPFLIRQMTSPQGISQPDMTAQITQAMAGSGGATAGLTGAAGKMAATTRNPMGFSAALDEAARQRAKASAGQAADVAAKNVDVKLQQQKDAAQQLGGLYGTDVRGQLEAMGQQAPDIAALTQAGKSGWLQNLLEIANTATGGYSAYTHRKQ